MLEKDKQEYIQKYTNSIHILGRITSTITLILLVGAPFVIGQYLGVSPDLGVLIKAFFGIGIVYLVSAIVEYLV